MPDTIKTTLELRHGDLISARGIIREVDGVSPAEVYTWPANGQPYDVGLRYLPGSVSKIQALETAEWRIVEGTAGDLAPFDTALELARPKGLGPRDGAAVQSDRFEDQFWGPLF